MAKREKRGSLKYQMTQALNSQKRFGQSRHEGKEATKQRCIAEGKPVQNIKADGVYSKGTADLYRNYVVKFHDYVKENHSDIKNMEDITKEHCYEYLKSLEDRGLSANTVSTAQASLNKVFDYGLNKKEGGLENRSYQNNTRSQVERNHDTRYNPDNYKTEITIAKAFGVRRESLDYGDYKLKEGFSIYQNEQGELRACVIEKGGKYREAPCLKSMEEQVREVLNDNIPFRTTEEANHMAYTKQSFIEAYNSCENEYISNSYTNLIDNHAFRKEYAKNYYEEVSEKLHTYTPGLNPTKIQYGTYDKEFDKQVLSHVSVALGHGEGRFGTTVNNYVR